MEIEKFLGNLTEEQITMAKQCKSPEEFLRLAGAEGIDLTDEQMDALSGGNYDYWQDPQMYEREGINTINCPPYIR